MLGRGRRILGITGPPGAGKSSLALALLEEFHTSAVVIPMDGFHLSNKQLALLGRSERKGAADTFDAAGYVTLLRRLRVQQPGEVIYAPQFHRDIEESIAAEIAVTAEIELVITEGNYLLFDTGAWKGVASLLDEVWYLDTDPVERRRRLVERHQQFGRSHAAAKQWVETTDEPNARQIEACRERATWRIRL